jgi:hypothetical protein
LEIDIFDALPHSVTVRLLADLKARWNARYDRGVQVEGLQDLVVNIVAAIVVFTSGVAARETVRLVKSQRSRSFWGRRLLRGKTFLFIGSFLRLNHLEPSGFVGGGDMRALQEISSVLARNGATFEVAYSSRISGHELHENMVLLGLDETNSLTVGMFERLGSEFRVDSDAMTITDMHTGSVYGAEWEVDSLDATSSRRDLDSSWFITTETDGSRSARRITADYGVIVRGDNPFAPGHTLIMMAGIYGFGTWRAAQLVHEDDFLRRCGQVRNFECLFRVEVHQEQLLTTSIIALRPLGESPREPILPSDGDHFGSRPLYAPDDSPRAATADGASDR